jgi:hypothetical protein
MQASEQKQTAEPIDQTAALIHELNALKIIVAQLVKAVAGDEDGLQQYLKKSDDNQG